MSVYVKTFKNKNHNLKLFRFDDDKLLEKNETIWTKTKDLENIASNALSVYDDRYQVMILSIDRMQIS